MDCVKIGRLLCELRKQKNLTQAQVADALGISNKTVSKWECGLGCPDLPLWSGLSEIFGVDVVQLMEGEISRNAPNNGNMKNIKFFCCPVCGNVLTATGEAAIYCCGRKLEPLEAKKEDAPQITVEVIDNDYFVTVDHPMEKAHFLSFAACVTGDKCFFQKLYPEQDAYFRIPRMARGILYLYCSEHGLFRYLDLMKKR